MNSLIKASLGCLIASTLSFSAYANAPGSQPLDTQVCPPASMVKDTKFNIAIGNDGKYYVAASKPVVYKDQFFWVSVGRALVADSESDALSTASDLLASLTGPVSDKPTSYVFPDDGFGYSACQYNTSDSNVVITAAPDF